MRNKQRKSGQDAKKNNREDRRGKEKKEGRRQIGPPALSQCNAGQSRLRDYLLRQSLSIACDKGRAGAPDS